MKTLPFLSPILVASWSHQQDTAPGFLKEGLGWASQWESLPHTCPVFVNSSGEHGQEARSHGLGLHREPAWGSIAEVGVAAGPEANTKTTH